jgi:hypothetical protein
MKKLLKEYFRLLLENSLISKGKIFTLTSPKLVVHRTSNPELTADDLDPMAIRQTRQSKRNSSPMVGLYTYGIENDVPRYGENKIEVEIPAGTKVLDLRDPKLRGTSSRISLEDAKELLASNIKAIVGYDFVGPEEWILLELPRK